MRYTLRLLTLQQFQRATALHLRLRAASAARRWRRATSAGARTPFRIGLWVGPARRRRTRPTTPTSAVKQDARQQLGGGAASARRTSCTTAPGAARRSSRGRDIEVDMRRGRPHAARTAATRSAQCPFTPTQAARRGAAGRRRRRGDLPAAAGAADRHGRQVRPDAVEGRGRRCSSARSTAAASATASARPRSRTPTRHPRDGTALPRGQDRRARRRCARPT